MTVEIKPLPHSGNLNLKILGREVRITDPDLSDIPLKNVRKTIERLDVAYTSAIELERLVKRLPRSL